jgi:uncharacterized membrane protein
MRRPLTDREKQIITALRSLTSAQLQVLIAFLIIRDSEGAIDLLQQIKQA